MTRVRCGDRGAVGIFTAIVVIVLFGFMGLAVDVGAMYDERRQLANGADAAVLAIAEDCALEVISCDRDTANVIAAGFASASGRSKPRSSSPSTVTNRPSRSHIASSSCSWT